MVGSERAADPDSESMLERARAETQRSTDPRGPAEMQERRLGNRATGALLQGRHAGGIPAPPTGGQPMEPSVLARMEASFGQDLSAVRVHTDGGSADSAEELGAKAYTVADDIVFGPGRYAPDTQVGHTLLAHELSHVLQQRRGTAQGGATGAEAEARQVGAHSAAGGQVSVQSAGTGGAQLDPKDDDDQVLRAFQREQQKKANPPIGSPEWVRLFQGSPPVSPATTQAQPSANAHSAPPSAAAPDTFAPRPFTKDEAKQLRAWAETPRTDQPGNNAHSVPPSAAGPDKFVPRPFTKEEAERLRVWAETPVSDKTKTAAPNPASAGEPRSKWLALLSVAVDMGRLELKMRIQAVIPDHFFEFGQARRGLVAGLTGLPLPPPTDEFDLTQWERGQNGAALIIGVDMLAGGFPPPGGGRPGLALAGGGRLRLEPPPTPIRPAGAPALEARGLSSPPATAAGTVKAPAVVPGGPPTPQSEEERRAQLARTPSDKTAPIKPGETPAQAKERTDAAQKKFEESGGEVQKIVGKVEDHHVVTNKTENSPAANQSKQILENARTDPTQPDLLTSDENIVGVEDHGEAHGENYHVVVRNRLVKAVDGLTPRTPAYRDAVLKELGNLKRDCQTKGTNLNTMTIKRSAGGQR